jgi:LuxR family transcriptional regulator
VTNRALHETSRVITEISRASSSEELRAKFGDFCQAIGIVEDEQVDALICVCQVFWLKLDILEKIYAPELEDLHNPEVALTDKQIEIVKWIREGKSNTDIATIMNLPVRTIRYHVSEIIRKLGVATRAQAACIKPHQP